MLIPPGIDGTYVVEQFPVSDACILRELPELPLVEPVPGVEPDPQVLPPVSVANGLLVFTRFHLQICSDIYYLRVKTLNMEVFTDLLPRKLPIQTSYPLSANVMAEAKNEHIIHARLDLEYECKHPRCKFTLCKNDTIEHENVCEHRMVPCPDYECCTQQQQCNGS